MEQPGENRLESFLLDSAERGRRGWRLLPPALLVLLALLLACGWWWSREPALPDAAALAQAAGSGVPGMPDVLVLEAIAGTLLDKPGGYLANDRLPPGLLLDNMPAFERGVLTHVRDMTRALRRDFSREQVMAVEDPALLRAESRFHFDHASWLVPSSESEYATGRAALADYRARLAVGDAAFFPRADSLARWLEDANARLGSQARRLGNAVDDGSGGAGARTPWLQVDEVFYESRGYCWALLAQLRAVQLDFAEVLAQRQATALLAQAIRELEGTQRPVRSPVILNGSEYGVLANHSLVMAGYVARANGALLQLRELLARRP